MRWLVVISLSQTVATVPLTHPGEYMTDNPSEIPQTMHELAEQKLKQAHAAYDQLTAYMNNAMGAWMGAIPPSPATAGLKVFQDHAMELAKLNAESAFTFAGKIANAKTPQEVLALQAQFAQDRMQTFVKQTQGSTG